MIKYDISIIGMGYVGLSTAIGFASKGHNIIAHDIDEEKVALINDGVAPFYEPNLTNVLQKVIKNGNLKCTSILSEPIQKTDITFITVGTPNTSNKRINLQNIKNISKDLGRSLKNKAKYHLVVIKSTVTPGTTNTTVKTLLEKFSEKKCSKDFGLCVNPEFLREGSALQDTLYPDRIIIGESDEKAGSLLHVFYKNFYNQENLPIMRTNIPTAELIKYANNSFLATKISFINTIANICEKIPNVDVTIIAKGIGLDKRINSSFLNAGIGYGGSCLPKDVDALIMHSLDLGYDPQLLQTIQKVNEEQPQKIIDLCKKSLGSLADKKISLLGLSFKPNTDDIREARSIIIINQFLKERASLSVYDPAAISNVKTIFQNKIHYASNIIECLKEADCCIIITEWEEFKKLRPEDFLKYMKKPLIIDGRRIYDPKKFSKKTTYRAIGLG
jgi:UDPglucose 6-dehydrogenase